MKKIRFFFFCAALVCGLTSCLSTNVEETKTETVPDYEIISTKENLPYIEASSEYPQFFGETLSKMNSEIKSFAEKEYKMYRDEAKAEFSDPRNPDPRKHSYALTVFQTASTKTSRSVILKTASYTGGAHYNSSLTSFSFDSSSGKQISITQATGMTLAEISAEARKQLLAEGLDKSMVFDGTSPDEKNFSNFAISEKSVTIYFEPYQVASYADGIRKVTLERK